MNLEKEKMLVEKYPLLYRDRYAPISKTGMCWGFQCGTGWFDLIDRLSAKLECLIKELSHKETPEYYIAASTVKEKWGELRFYITCGTDEMLRLIDEAERESTTICEWCGSKGQTINSKGWYMTICDGCNNERNTTSE